MSAQLVSHVDVQIDAMTLSDARDRVRATLREWGVPRGAATDDALLVASELVANAVRHGGAIVAFELDRRADGVLISVRDSSVRFPQARRANDFDESGRGLHIVESLSARWGTDAVPGGKRVWAFVKLLR